MNDLLSPMENQSLSPREDSYSAYSLGILLGILTVALNLAVAVVAAVNAALSSHLSLRPEQKAPNIEAYLIFCMTALFGTAVVSGGSLILLSINIDLVFTLYVGALFLLGVGVSLVHVLELFGSHWLKCMYKTPLVPPSITLSTVAFILAVAGRDVTIWVIIPGCYFTLTYHLFIDIPLGLGKRSIRVTFFLCFFWTACSVGPFFFF